MILKVNFNDDEITRFFQRNGYIVVPHMRGRWVPAYQGRCEWVETEVPGLLINNRVIDAGPVFQKFQERRVKELFSPVGDETRENINNIINNLR